MKIVITGASSGLGMETAKLFIKNGWAVTVCARRTERLEELKALSEKVKTAFLDVNSPESADTLAGLLNADSGTDIYFHASGIGCHNLETNLEKEFNVLNTNCLGFSRCIITAFNYFKQKGGGHIAAISSIAGTKGLGAAPSYSASKAMNNVYLQALAQLSRTTGANITFTDIKPGFVKTALLDSQRSYPLLMSKEYAARKIYKAIIKKKRKAIIDWKYAILVFFWKLIPDFVWERIRIDASENKKI
ncbi:MAG: SDR family NAD(P)-dependent oxidoreductase [Bacteroidales bacterium]|nr:SDR family NAD(P)-dependent oxidoreductase [Bacteroidales bacterium]